MSLPYLSLTDARNLHLAAQGLLKKPRRRALASDILPTITRMSLLQIDTINIVPTLCCSVDWAITPHSGWMMRWLRVN